MNQSRQPKLGEPAYSYDANGNLQTLTPPGEPAHRFESTPIDREAAYIPPALDKPAMGTKRRWAQTPSNVASGRG